MVHMQFSKNISISTIKRLLSTIFHIHSLRILSLNNVYCGGRLWFSCLMVMSKRKLQPEIYYFQKKRVVETVALGRSTVKSRSVSGRCISSQIENVQDNCACFDQAPPQPAGDRCKLTRPDLVCPEPVIARGVSHKPQYNISKGKDIETEGKLATCVQEDTVSQNHFESCQDGCIGNAEDVNINAENNKTAALCAENEEILYCQPSEVQPLDSQPRHSDRSDMTPSDSQPQQPDRSDMTPPDSQPRHSDRSDMTPSDSQPRHSDRSDMTPPDSQPRQPNRLQTPPPDSQWGQSARQDTTPPDFPSLQPDRPDTTATQTEPDTVNHKKTKPTVLPKHVLAKVEHVVSKKCESDISWIQDVAMHPSTPTLSDAEEECLFGNLFSDQKENLKTRNQASHEKKKGHDESGGDPRGQGVRQIPRKPSPNYFVAVQITNPQIHSGLSQVQQEVMAVNHKMREVMIKLPTLHITLMVMNLQTEEDIARAIAALTESGSELRERLKTLPVLEVAGLGTFRNQVVFAKVSPGDALDDLTHIHGCVTDKMADHGVVSMETRGLTPHITIMKMSMAKPAFRRSVAKKIDLSLYSKFKDMTFGTETVQRLQLCAMLKPKVTSGYYHVAHEVYLGRGEVTLSEFSHSLVQSSIVSAIESVKLDSVKSQVNSQNSKGKLEHKPQKKKHKTKRSKELKKESGNGGVVLKPGKADSTVK